MGTLDTPFRMSRGVSDEAVFRRVRGGRRRRLRGFLPRRSRGVGGGWKGGPGMEDGGLGGWCLSLFRRRRRRRHHMPRHGQGEDPRVGDDEPPRPWSPRPPSPRSQGPFCKTTP